MTLVKRLSSLFATLGIGASLSFFYPVHASETEPLVSVNHEPVFQAKFNASDLLEAPVKLIPYPQNVTWGDGSVPVRQLRLMPSQGVSKILEDELYQIASSMGVELNPQAEFYIKFQTDHRLPDEGYRLTTSITGIVVSASSETGHFYALQTLRKLMEVDKGEVRIQLSNIEDAPAHQIRGYMIDTGRNYQSLPALKKQLDIMSKYKMNVFHWHLTDRPAWRVESKKYPELTAAENHRPTRDPGRHYTYDQMRELITYANKRHITVIPEIDMPGHSDSFVTSTGVRMESERGMQILEDVLREFFAEIPVEMAPMIHIGSDEVNIPNPDEFISRMVDIVEGDGRKAIIWSPGLTARDSVIRQSWGESLKVDHTAQEIDSRFNYINTGEPMTLVRRLFFRPAGWGSPNEILGGIICLWPDVNLISEDDAIKQNPLYPALLTYAWSVWTADILTPPDNWVVRAPTKDSLASDYYSAFENSLLEHKERYFTEEPFPYFPQSDIHWEITGPHSADDVSQFWGEQLNDASRNTSEAFNWTQAAGATLFLNLVFSKQVTIQPPNRDK